MYRQKRLAAQTQPSRLALWWQQAGDVINATEPFLQVRNLALLLLGAGYAAGGWPAPQFVLAGWIITGPLLWGGLYLLNDYTDVEADRLHPLKRDRPLPSGRVSPTAFLILSVLFISSGLVLAAFVNPLFFAAVAVLALKQLLYTIPPFRFKTHFILDVVTGSLFNGTLRVLCGWWLVSNRLDPPLVLLIAVEAAYLAGYLLRTGVYAPESALKSQVYRRTTIARIPRLALKVVIALLWLLAAVATLALAFNDLWHIYPVRFGVFPLHSLYLYAVFAIILPILVRALKIDDLLNGRALSFVNDELPLVWVLLGVIALVTLLHFQTP